MKKIYQLALSFLMTASVTAQQIYPTSVSSAGNSSSSGGIILESSIGGLSVSTISNTAFMYTQGFLQPDAGVATTVPYINDVKLDNGYGIDNAGTTFINGNIMLEFTTGEFTSITHINGSNMLTQGLLQPYVNGAVLPVTGLDLTAKRTDAQTVLLNWKTMQEFNNKGFHIERKYENENSFAAIGFVATAAAGGNSNAPLFYQHTDNNSFAGKTFYRIRQEDIDGGISYSPVRFVDGSIVILINMKAWPVPSSGPVNVEVSGLSSTDRLMVFDMNGRLIQQQSIQNNEWVVLNKLVKGTYLLRLAGNKELVKKIIIQ